MVYGPLDRDCCLCKERQCGSMQSTHPLLGIIFDFTVRGMTTKYGLLEGSLFGVVSGICRVNAEQHFTALAHILPSSSGYEELPCASRRSNFEVCNSDSCLTL